MIMNDVWYQLKVDVIVQSILKYRVTGMIRPHLDESQAGSPDA